MYVKMAYHVYLTLILLHVMSIVFYLGIADYTEVEILWSDAHPEIIIIIIIIIGLKSVSASEDVIGDLLSNQDQPR